MWEISIREQLLTVLYSIIVGLFLSFVFDFFKLLRQCFKHKKFLIFIEDVIFFIDATFITFMLLMARCNGEVRSFVLFFDFWHTHSGFSAYTSLQSILLAISAT